MILTRLEITNFRNIKKLVLLPSPGINIIYGDNAQGKTNLIEALWLFTGTKSFRQSKDSEFIRFRAKHSLLRAEFDSEGRSQNAEILFSPQKSMKKNGIKVARIADYFGTCGGVVFSPSHMNLFRDGPSERRRMMDTSICQISPKFARVLADYNHVVIQRNTLLRDTSRHEKLFPLLDVFDSQLAKLGGFLIRTRVRYCFAVTEKAKTIYEGLSGGREKFDTIYKCTVLENDEHVVLEATNLDWSQRFYNMLQMGRKRDLQNASTNIGPHRDDLEITLDGLPVRSFGSQGQQRSCILALKLAESQMLGEIQKEPPMILLDDVMSELDFGRREYILNSIGNSQIFLTCCDKELLTGLEGGRVFYMKDGVLSEEE